MKRSHDSQLEDERPSKRFCLTETEVDSEILEEASVEEGLETSQEIPVYASLSETELLQQQETDTNRIRDLLQLSPSDSRILLKKWRWNLEKLLQVFFEKGKEAFEMVTIMSLTCHSPFLGCWSYQGKSPSPKWPH